MSDAFGIILWVVIIAVVAIVFFGGRLKKKNYEGQSMEVTKNWYEISQNKYDPSSEKKAYFFEPDKNFLTVGHLLVNRNEKPVYEAKILYGDAINGYEADFTNHLIGYTHHHKISATVSEDSFLEGSGAIVAKSYFLFDGENIWEYIKNLGYDYHLERTGLAYQLNVTRNGALIGNIYSSDTKGENYFQADGEIQPMAGSPWYYIIECADEDMDGLFLLAMAFSRTDLSWENLK